ncbi:MULTISPECIES: DJ-1/PfpI family protein [Bacillus]|uniref:DJ-1/PfpI family protein n=1 Tax=Bacillus TaxID=1386 RepID=UPI0022430784|nr:MULTISPECIES: DJ-1/PfpI family protein [Bacillus]MDN5388463.1 DJ-1/PfpI family protein [Bacillus sp. LB7]MEC1023175.1 DJ-1/PfpI family protein [Bacillus paralicheniformis]MEC1025741.1 DJ-1/PfpI family protein [Bacillus paralicheniformis]MEC1035843.1 DJ-1/PfpI family protein [Bacillus paralicheniformis]MEC1050019.1 DJ-1/PfpI family protein [Bacillus paralicheniformis]
MKRTRGFRLGVYIFKDAEIIDYAAPYGVFSVARRLDPELDAFLVADAMKPVQTQAGLIVHPNYSFNDQPDMDAFLIPGGFGTRQETNNKRLHQFIRSLPESTILVSVCTGSWIYGRMGLLDGLSATSRKEPDRLEASEMGQVPIDRLADIAPACRVSRARIVDSGRIITAGGIASGMEMGFHLLRRAGYDESFIEETARVMEYQEGYSQYRNDIEYVRKEK